MAHAGRAFQSRTHTMRFLFPVVFQLFHQKHQFCTGTARLASGSQLVLFSVKTVSRKWATQPWHLCDNSIAGIINGTEDALQPWRHGWSWIGKADQPCMCKKNALWNSYSTGSVLVVCEFRVVILRMLIMYIPRTARKRIALRGQRTRGLKSWILNRFQIRKCEHLQAKSKRAASQACARFFTRKIY